MNKKEPREKIGELLGRCQMLIQGAEFLNKSNPQYSYYNSALREIMAELRMIYSSMPSEKMTAGLVFPLQGKYRNIAVPVEKEVKEIAQDSLNYLREGKYHAGEALLQYVVYRLKEKDA